MAVYFYRGIEFVKSYFVLFFNRLFLAAEKGQITFTDGTREIIFSKRPFAIRQFAEVSRGLPCILVGPATTDFKYISINKDVYDGATGETEVTGPVAQQFNGGEILVSMNFTVMATQMPERDQLTDIMCIFLSHPDTKDFFQQQSLDLPEGPRVSGESEADIPGVDRPIFVSTISMPVLGQWQDRVEVGPRLREVLAEIDTISADVEVTTRIDPTA